MITVIDRMEEFTEFVEQWASAYPLDVFPEPDFARVREVLSTAGLSLDQVSAANMRHVITHVRDKLRLAVKSEASRWTCPNCKSENRDDYHRISCPGCGKLRPTESNPAPATALPQTKESSSSSDSVAGAGPIRRTPQ